MDVMAETGSVPKQVGSPGNKSTEIPRSKTGSERQPEIKTKESKTDRTEYRKVKQEGEQRIEHKEGNRDRPGNR